MKQQEALFELLNLGNSKNTLLLMLSVSAVPTTINKSNYRQGVIRIY